MSVNQDIVFSFRNINILGEGYFSVCSTPGHVADSPVSAVVITLGFGNSPTVLGQRAVGQQ